MDEDDIPALGAPPAVTPRRIGRPPMSEAQKAKRAAEKAAAKAANDAARIAAGKKPRKPRGPNLTPEEREARRQAANAAWREQKAAKRAARQAAYAMTRQQQAIERAKLKAAAIEAAQALEGTSPDAPVAGNYVAVKTKGSWGSVLTAKRQTMNRLDTEPDLFAHVKDCLINGVPDEATGKRVHTTREWDVLPRIGMTYGGLLAWCREDETGEREKQLREALKLRGRVLAEDAMYIADSVVADPRQAVAKADLQVRTRHFLARSYDKELFHNAEGGNVGVAVQVVMSKEEQAL